jgi:UDP-glucose/iron transport system ATP-binding protein
VSASRGGRIVLDGLDLDVDHGATAIVGPSGCGKSTLLRLLNRLADPDAGAIAYRDAPITDRDVLELRREVVLVPQLPALVEGSVADNVAFGPKLAARPADDAGVARALTLAGLGDDFADRDAGGLSVGEQQRVMLARSLALQPAVLLLDEPTSALDETARDAIEATLADLRRRLDTSFVVVTHDPGQARRLAERVVKIG